MLSVAAGVFGLMALREPLTLTTGRALMSLSCALSEFCAEAMLAEASRQQAAAMRCSLNGEDERVFKIDSWRGSGLG
jgi:hypothetical protein